MIIFLLNCHTNSHTVKDTIISDLKARRTSTVIFFKSDKQVNDIIGDIFKNDKNIELTCSSFNIKRIFNICKIVSYEYYESDDHLKEVADYVKSEVKSFKDDSTCTNILFAVDTLTRNKQYGSVKSASPYSPYSIYKYGIGVCQGYTRFLAMFLTELGIENGIATGSMYNEKHTWNTVKLDGKWYFIDVTNYITQHNKNFILFGTDYAEDLYQIEYCKQNISNKSFGHQ